MTRLWTIAVHRGIAALAAAAVSACGADAAVVPTGCAPGWTRGTDRCVCAGTIDAESGACVVRPPADPTPPGDTCALTTDTPLIAFLPAAPGETSGADLIVTNPCSLTKRLEAVHVFDNGDGAFRALLDTTDRRLAAGETLVIPILFAPSAGTHVPGDPSAGRARLRWARGPDNGLVVELRAAVARPEGACARAYAPDEAQAGGAGVVFPRTLLGRSRRRSVIVENCGRTPLTVLAAAVETGADDCPFDPRGRPACAVSVDPPPLPAVVAAGSRLSVPVDFRPAVEGPQAARIVIRTDAERTNDERTRFVPSPTDAAQIVTAVTGRGGSPRLEIVPAALRFGVMPVGCGPVERRANLWNTGDEPVEIEGLRSVRADGATVSAEPAFGPLSIVVPAAGAVPLALRLTPGAPGAVGGDTAVDGRDGDAFTLLLAHDGAAAGRGERVDRRRLPDVPKVDVLWVVDCSGSMSEEQAGLRAGFERFAARAAADGADWRFAVTTTDTDTAARRGALVGDPPIKSSADLGTGIVAAFSRDADVGTSCSSIERGFEGARLALARAAADPSLRFPRPDAVLAIVFVSDENDQSPLPPAYYRDYFTAAADNEDDRLRLFAVVGPQGGCGGPGGNADDGLRYRQLMEATGGTSLSICTPDFAAVQEAVAAEAFRRVRSVALSARADPDTVRVSINGVGVESGWRYDAGAGVIRFDVPPPAGAWIETRYTPACENPTVVERDMP